MTDEVGMWVLNTTRRQVRAWQENGIRDLKMESTFRRAISAARPWTR